MSLVSLATCLLISNACPNIAGWAAPVKIKTITIWAKAFIPKDVNGVTFPVEKGPNVGKSAIAGPAFPGSQATYCYLGDERGFSSNPKAEARMHSLVRIDLDTSNSIHEPKCWPSFEILRATGETTEKTASTDRIQAKDISIVPAADGSTAISFRLDAASRNPFFNNIGALAPDINWDVKVTVKVHPGRQWARVSVDGLIEPFPAAEMYVSINEQPATSIFQESPLPGKTPADLYGPINRQIKKEVSVACALDGDWRSIEAGGRFRLKVSGDSCEWTEYSGSGATITRAVKVQKTPQGLLIERPNDDEILTFLGFSVGVIAEIKAKSPGNVPRPSFILLSGTDGKLSGLWSGILVTKNANGSVNEVFQPGQKPAKQFVFQ